MVSTEHRDCAVAHTVLGPPKAAVAALIAAGAVESDFRRVCSGLLATADSLHAATESNGFSTSDSCLVYARAMRCAGKSFSRPLDARWFVS